MSTIRTLLAASLLLLGAPRARADALPLWEVAGSNGRVILMGSIHFLRPGQDALPEEAIEAVRESDAILMELDLDDLDPVAAQAAMQRYGIDPQGRTLDVLLGSRAWASAQAKAKKLGLDLAAFRAFEPWLAAITVSQLQLASLGYDASAGVEQQILALAREDRKEIRGLESVEQQFSALDSLPTATQAAFLEQTLDEAVMMREEIGRMINAWRSGDSQTMAREFLGPVQEQPELYRRIVVERNGNWVRQLTPLLRVGKDYLVVVGTLHLVGPDSVVALLQQAGYTVQQVEGEADDD
jgi:uncharacterized protein YbaP (TraB family)